MIAIARGHCWAAFRRVECVGEILAVSGLTIVCRFFRDDAGPRAQEQLGARFERLAIIAELGIALLHQKAALVRVAVHGRGAEILRANFQAGFATRPPPRHLWYHPHLLVL